MGDRPGRELPPRQQHAAARRERDPQDLPPGGILPAEPRAHQRAEKGRDVNAIGMTRLSGAHSMAA